MNLWRSGYERRCHDVFRLGLIVATVLSGAAARLALGATWYVAPGGNDTNTCGSPAAPCASVQGAVDKADPGDTVLLALGSYTASGATSVVTLPDALTLDGGWDPGFTTRSGLSTLDGEGTRRGLAVGWGVSAVVRRLTIVNGWSGDFGGGVLNEGTLTVEMCHIRGNYAYGAGGGIFSSGSLTLRSSAILDNVSGQNAGGVYSYGTLVAENITVTSNTAFGIGGGILKEGDGGSVLLASVTLAFNRAALAGGLFAFGDVTIRNSIVNGNRSQREGGDCYGNIGALDYTSMGDPGTCALPTGTGNVFGAAPGLGAALGAPAYLPLAASSPAVDAGDPGGCVGIGGLLSLDQRGAARSGRCDMGAYEYLAPAAGVRIVAASGAPQRTAPSSAFPAPLVAAVLDAAGTPVGGVSVDFTAPGGGGASAGLPSATSATAVTDGFGLASVPARANPTPGSYTVIAAGTGLGPPTVFGLTNGGWYVSPTGDDAADCSTPSTPCATVEGALDQTGFQDGDTVLLAGGRYRAEFDPVGPPPTAAVVLGRSSRLVGGWGASFAAQDGGPSILDGEGRWPGLQASGGTVSIGEQLVVEGGTTSYSGGGVRVAGSDLTLVHVTVAGNSARWGGGIHNGGFLTIDRCRVEDNMASDEGGGIFNEGHLLVSRSTIRDNRATSGGGIQNADLRNLVLEISTVSGNRAIAGGGGLRSSGTTYLSSATVARNEADWGGGLEQTAGDVRLRNTIVGQNTASTGPDCQGSLTTLGYNLIGDDSGCDVVPAAGDLVLTDPGIGPLVGDPPYHPLLAGSPAIDAGDSTGCEGLEGPLAADQRGLPRQGRCDIGSYEYAPAGPAATVYAWGGTPQRTFPGRAFVEPLQAAVLDAVGSPVPSALVGFRAPVTGAGGTFGASRSPAISVATDSGGIATAPALLANGTGGAYVVSGSVSGVAWPALFSLINAGGLYVAPTGSDTNDCFARATPCATPGGALALAAPGDTVFVAAGTYTGLESPVLAIDTDVTLSGGWNPSFSAQTGTSVLDGEGQRTVLEVNATATLERFGVRHGFKAFGSFAGGILNEGTLTLRLSDVSDNAGGGIANSGTLTLDRATVQGNTNNSGAGGIGPFAGLGGTITVVDSTISGNHSTYQGGGLAVGPGIASPGLATIVNSTVSGNTADFAGGGISNEAEGVLIVRNSTITANVGVKGGGGLLCGSSTSTTLEGSIVAGNVGGPNFGGPDCLGGPLVSQGGNLIGSVDPRDCQLHAVAGDIVGGLTPVDPRLGALAANGGPTATHALLTGSPALDSGGGVLCPDTDQRGRLRPADGDGNGIAVCDRGAFEAAAPALVSITVGNPSVLEGDDDGATAIFPLTLTAASTRTVSVLVDTADGTASAGLDYRAVTDAVAFPPGATQRTFGVPILGDRFNEPDETFVLRLSNPINGTLSNAEGVATVFDDDPPGLVVSDTIATLLPGQPGVASFPVTLSPPSASSVSVDFSTSDGTATSPADYTSVSGTVLFPPGERTEIVAVPVAPGAVGTKNFYLTLTNPSGGVALVEDQAMAAITGPGSFYTLTPCRLLDTRQPDSSFGGPSLAPHEGRIFTLAGRCGIPITAVAVSVNLTVASSTGPGNLRLYPADNPLPLVSTINYTAGVTRANNAVVALGHGGRLVIYCSQAAGTVEAILDVNGYFE